MRADLDDVTVWLNRREADATPAPPGADGGRFAWLYDELHRIARAHMRHEDPGHTLSATALTHEAWFRMNGQTRTLWTSRGHFLAVASTMMRRILVNHALARRAAKRDAGLREPLTLGELQALGAQTPADVVEVHEALAAFEKVDARAAKVVELKFFGGLEHDEIAQALEVSVATVKRDWTVARAWLHRALAPG
jgi:RNA polymerase sigma factor (TIGR02999 family)